MQTCAASAGPSLARMPRGWLQPDLFFSISQVRILSQNSKSEFSDQNFFENKNSDFKSEFFQDFLIKIPTLSRNFRRILRLSQQNPTSSHILCFPTPPNNLSVQTAT